ncbi:hypothetical protein ACHHYP_00082 [Achlya hypogyna]|uniref:SGNH hydrolase-type esterase domain-containing protein n=1 Tax=Achlya hypogyna TaxID=1202772 RepID=A0A1V9ZC14_ACHHY|nr:hypothetical protein ACHHYP_00082 [Achlya hypogyna]
MLGDSLTEYASNVQLQGFQATLSRAYIRKADVINRGKAGWTTRDWLPVLPDLIDEWRAKPPSLITICLGANDAALEYLWLYVPLPEYATKLRQIVELFRAAFPAAKFILMTPGATDDTTVIRDIRSNERTGTYAAMCKTVGADLGLPVIDLWTPMQGVQKEMLVDGLHFSAAGNAFVHGKLLETIRAVYPALAPEVLPYTR